MRQFSVPRTILGSLHPPFTSVRTVVVPTDHIILARNDDKCHYRRASIRRQDANSVLCAVRGIDGSSADPNLLAQLHGG